ncbi:MAG: IS66 family insertion sequence element accessory protein TnpB [Muribaculaceae bacterium]|nr:IS66 family insertion sequence element accessory protein TnpB [Muribaculaceae bacterium]
MFCLNDTMRHHLWLGRTDMRKGINSLIAVVKNQMDTDVRNYDEFIFIGSSHRLMKLLHAEDDGVIYIVDFM